MEAKEVKLKLGHRLGKLKLGIKRWEAKAGKLKHGTNTGKLILRNVVPKGGNL